jgi:hypothetical protein
MSPFCLAQSCSVMPSRVSMVLSNSVKSRQGSYRPLSRVKAGIAELCRVASVRFSQAPSGKVWPSLVSLVRSRRAALHHIMPCLVESAGSSHVSCVPSGRVGPSHVESSRSSPVSLSRAVSCLARSVVSGRVMSYLAEPSHVLSVEFSLVEPCCVRSGPVKSVGSCRVGSGHVRSRRVLSVPSSSALSGRVAPCLAESSQS